jgi:2-dehydro-3-deoxyglucarate aldolase
MESSTVESNDSIREHFENDEVAIGARATSISPTLVEVYGDIGLDFVWIDLEHTGWSPTDATALEDLTRAAEVAGTDVLVRLPSGDPDLVRKALDAGVRTLLIPRVETMVEVREAVRASRVTHEGAPGERGAAAGRATTWGNRPDDYATSEDEHVCVGVMIENATAVENLDDILGVEGLGFAFLGPSDLSISLGHPFETDHPEVREAIERARVGALEASVPLGGIANDATAAREAIDEGYRLLRIGDEVAAARSVLGDRVAEIRD